MRHWAAKYIGRRWSVDGLGPDSFSCWGLVREAYRERYGIELPLIHVGGDLEADRKNVTAIKRAAEVSGMRPMLELNHQQPREGDIVLLRGIATLHCGLVIYANKRMGVLHSAHEIGVVFEGWREACTGAAPELWRKCA